MKGSGDRRWISLVALSFGYPGAATRALGPLSLEVARGELVVVVGPSGCGKTTLLRLVAGFERPQAGTIAIAGRPVSGPRVQLPPEARRVGMVFQDYALFPHLTVRQNVGFGLRGPRPARRREVERLLALVGLTAQAERYPHELSGGEQQRAALARTLAPNPSVVLLDEPFSNLDAALRREVRSEVRSLLKRLGSTAILVTHDQEEALELGGRVAVLNAGQLEQVGPPLAVYRRPRTPFVARFLGRADFLPVAVRDGGLDSALGRLPRPARLPAGRRLYLMLRPEQLEVSLTPLAGGVPVRVVANKAAGLSSVHCLEIASGQRVHSARLGPCRLPEGRTAYARLRVEDPVLFADLDVAAPCLFGAQEASDHCQPEPTWAHPSQPA